MNGMRSLAKRVQYISEKLLATNQVLDDFEAWSRLKGPMVFEYLEQEIEQLLVKRRPPEHPHIEEEPDALDRELRNTPFGTHLSYLHNEFVFNSARPLHEFALVTHFSMAPIHSPKLSRRKFEQIKAALAGDSDRLNVLSRIEDDHRHKFIPSEVEDALESIRSRAIHDPNSHSFRGDRDNVSATVTKFLDFSQQIITTRRSVERFFDDFKANARETGHSAFADNWNREIENEVKDSGLSARACMLREYILRATEDKRALSRITWVRHHSAYQTFTAIEEIAAAPDALDLPSIECVAGAAPSLAALAQLINTIVAARKDQASRLNDIPAINCTALDSLPENWPSYFFGRYTQGANYVVVPLQWFFTKAFLEITHKHSRKDEYTPYELDEYWDRWVAAAGPSSKIGSHRHNYDSFIFLWGKSRDRPLLRRRAAAYLIRFLRPFVDSMMDADKRPRNFEFIASQIAGGAGILISNVKNLNQMQSSKNEKPILLSKTIIVDIEMNDYERGRVIKNLTEFSTERVMALSALARFQFLHAALSVIHTDLDAAVSQWQLRTTANRGQESVGVGTDPLRNSKDELEADQEFWQKLKSILLQLTMLNGLIDGGIGHRARLVDASVQALLTRLRIIDEQELPGFMSLRAFLEQRFTKAVRTIASVGKRYEAIRERINELSSLVSTQLALRQREVELDQNEKSRRLLVQIDSLTNFGIAYYASYILVVPLVAIAVLSSDMAFTKHIEAWIKLFVYAPLVLFLLLAWRKMFLASREKQSKTRDTAI